MVERETTQEYVINEPTCQNEKNDIFSTSNISGYNTMPAFQNHDNINITSRIIFLSLNFQIFEIVKY